MADQIITGARAVTQWGIGFANACGEAALAVVLGTLSGHPPAPGDVANLVRQGTQFGIAPSGTSTPSELTALANFQGLKLNRGPGGSAALATIDANLASNEPTILEVTNARAFGGGDAGVFGHYVTVIGKAANGSYIVADSNQQAAVSGKPVTYTAQQIMSANPFATLTPGAAGSLAPPWNQALPPGVTGLAGSGWFQGLVGGIGAKSPADLFWRAGLIIGGGVLIIMGIMIFFSHQEGSAVTVVTQAAGTAAKAAA